MVGHLPILFLQIIFLYWPESVFADNIKESNVTCDFVDNPFLVDVTAPTTLNGSCDGICIDFFQEWTVNGRIVHLLPENGMCRLVFDISRPTRVRVCRECECGSTCNEETCSRYFNCDTENPTESPTESRNSTEIKNFTINTTDLPGNKTAQNSKRLYNGSSYTSFCMHVASAHFG